MDKRKELSPDDIGDVVAAVTSDMRPACNRVVCVRHPQAVRVPVPGDPSAWRTEHMAVAFYCTSVYYSPLGGMERLHRSMHPSDACDAMDVCWRVWAAGPPAGPEPASPKLVPLCKRFNVAVESFGPTQVPPEVVRSIRRCTTFGDCQDLVLLTREVNAGVRKAVDCVMRAGGVPDARHQQRRRAYDAVRVDFAGTGEDVAAVLGGTQPGDMYRVVQDYQELLTERDSAASRAHEEVLRRLLDVRIPVYSLLDPDDVCPEGGPI